MAMSPDVDRADVFETAVESLDFVTAGPFCRFAAKLAKMPN